jgi:putative ABC transport system permease protein
MKARSPDQIPKLKELIDGRTKNSSDPTETITEREFANQFLQMMGNIKGMVLLISASVLLIMILMTANTMAMSVRERVTEVAVLRTLGFRSSQILSFIVLESVFITMTATALSLGVAFLIFNVMRKSPNELYFPVFMIAPSTAGGAMLAALVCGVASSIIPAVRAARRKIVDGLRQVV